MAPRKLTRSEKTRLHLFQVATKLFSEKGYKATTLSDIAKAADVSTGTLYRYYPSKGDFLMHIGINSVDHLEEFVQELPDDLPLVDAVLAVMVEDVRGTLNIFFDNAEGGDEPPHRRVSEARFAYSSEIYASEEHLNIELETRARLARIYAGLIKKAKDRGEISVAFDGSVHGQIIVAIFFAEFDKGMFHYDYPYAEKFREKLEALFEGKWTQDAKGERSDA